MNTNDDTEPLAHSFFGQPMTRDDRLEVIQAALIKRLEAERDALERAKIALMTIASYSEDQRTWAEIVSDLEGEADRLQALALIAAGVTPEEVREIQSSKGKRE